MHVSEQSEKALPSNDSSKPKEDIKKGNALDFKSLSRQIFGV